MTLINKKKLSGLYLGAISAAVLAFSACSEQPSAVQASSQAASPVSDELSKAAVYQTMKYVSDWQMSKFNQQTNLFEGYEEGAFMSADQADSHPQGWVYAAFHVGMAKWAKLAAEQGDESYFKQLADIAKRNQYLFAPRIYNADDYAIGQLYLDLYDQYQDPSVLEPLKTIFDIILLSPSTTDLYFKKIKVDPKADQDNNELPFDEFEGRQFSIVPCKSRWCWADALFMGPPVWMHLAKVTGEQKYFDFANKEFWETANLLWDKEDHLFFRDTRFFDRREANGEKIIWARGVGWVVAGLARILENVPAEHPQRADYEDIFKKVMARLVTAQQGDGLWRPSVLAPKSQPYKETSGTALIAYAYASGINQGLLDKQTYLPTVQKAWSGLVNAVQPDGKLGWVQQIGHAPDTVSADDTQIYGVGGFLLTGVELYKLAN
ncbi:glycoside hydrolase family 88/105 protein [Thalassotalea euphylliae]|uniref:Glycoside hydrolase family 88 protein n=1 Tax=Thalassotalea euphylliae TaxID=1655234 RepID=A0A3E0UE17_9GAMM|nr:glycoside hydrolase family 88 protein [Thalassotalea euphylliae]REL34345.1 glycoside hydrolase family 88 protein [Thalassotalea euphylliae]